MDQQNTIITRPRVDWYAKDLDDSSEFVSEESIFRDYASCTTTIKPRVYKAWIPLWLLYERLWEEVEGSKYPDWAKYKINGLFPPIKIDIDVILGKSLSYFQTIHIRDGNHRVRFWKQCSFIEAPAWVLDYRLFI